MVHLSDTVFVFRLDWVHNGLKKVALHITTCLLDEVLLGAVYLMK